MRNGSILRRYASAIAVPDGVTRAKSWTSFVRWCGYQRKYAIQLLVSKPVKSVRRPGRPSQYNQPVLLTVLRKLWLATDQMCSKRLAGAMPLWLPHYEVRFGALEESTRAKLTGISPTSIDRLLKPERVSQSSFTAPLHCASGQTRLYPFASLQEERQCSCRAEELDACPTVIRLRAFRSS